MSRFIYCYVECHYAECRYDQRRYAECHGAVVSIALQLHHPTSPSFLGWHGICRNKIICIMVPKVAKAAKVAKVAKVARTISVVYYMLLLRPQDTQHNDTHHNNIQQNNTQHNKY